jgi:hypothetical protein
MNRTNSVKFATIAVFVTVFAVPVALAQQTQTNCTLNGNTANCTSTTTPNGGAAVAQGGKDIGTASATIIAKIRARHQAQQLSPQSPQESVVTDKSRIMRCIQNPEEKTPNESGNIIGCSDFMVKMKSFCAAAPKYAACVCLPIQASVRRLSESRLRRRISDEPAIPGFFAI